MPVTRRSMYVRTFRSSLLQPSPPAEGWSTYRQSSCWQDLNDFHFVGLRKQTLRVFTFAFNISFNFSIENVLQIFSASSLVRFDWFDCKNHQATPAATPSTTNPRSRNYTRNRDLDGEVGGSTATMETGEAEAIQETGIPTRGGSTATIQRGDTRSTATIWEETQRIYKKKGPQGGHYGVSRERVQRLYNKWGSRGGGVREERRGYERKGE